LAVVALAADLDLNHPCLVAEDMAVASADLQCLEAVDSAATSAAVAVLVAVLLDHLCMAEASEEVSAVEIDSAAAINLAVEDLPSSVVDFQAWVAVWVEALEAIHSAVDVAVDVVDSAAIHFKVAA
tara:strand:+ start:145 stop:522 length:378 start_codon:yes stop_codon:yes gene_type:complete